MKKIFFLLLTSFLTSTAYATTIDFNDGINGNTITNQYSGLGVTFSNARYDSFISSGEGTVGAGGLKLVGNGVGGDSIYSPKQNNPIVVTFDFGITSFNITALNVGANGARIEAYDSQIGGNLLDFDEDFGTGVGGSNHPLLTISATSIFRVLLFTPLSVQTEGMLWDNVSFTPSSVVPVPAALLMFAPALLGFLGLRRKAKA
jgi:hypothetical protein